MKGRLGRTGWLKGATLMEVLVSLGLLSLMYVIFAMVWVQVNGNQSASMLWRHQMESRGLLDSLAGAPDAGNAVYERVGARYVQSVRRLGAGSALVEVVIAVYDQEGVLLLRRGRVMHEK